MPLPVLVFGIPLCNWLGVSVAANNYSKALGILILFTIAPIGVAIWAYSMAHFELEILATKDRLKVGKLIFDRAISGGILTGYESGGETIKDGVFDFSIGAGITKVIALRVSYGPWGEDTNYLVNGYHAAEYVVWLNHMIAAVGAPPPREHDLASGRRKENFGIATPFVPPAPKPAPERQKAGPAEKPRTQSKW